MATKNDETGTDAGKTVEASASAAKKPAAVKKPAAQKSTAQKSTAKKSTAQKSTAKKSTAKKSAKKPAAAEKPAATRTRKPVVKEDRIAIVAGLRSPFVKSWSTLNDVGPVELSTQVARELLFRLDFPMDQLDEIVWGTVITVPTAPNVAREIALNLSQYRLPGFSVSQACATGMQSLVSATRMIMTGEREVVLAGGVDVTSHAPVVHKKHVIDILKKAQKAKGLALMQTLAKLNPLDLLPSPPAIAERYTGKTMGEHAEMMAQNFEISRVDQEALAIESHAKAFKAMSAGWTAHEIMTVQTPTGVASEDNLIREHVDPAKLAKLRPAFDRKHGTITAATSSPLTDGAACVLVMRESKAEELGYAPLGFVRSWEIAALDPRVNLLLGNVYSVPGALRKSGTTLADMDTIEIHEAFAAQVLTNMKLMDSKRFCTEELGLSDAVGEIDRAKLNRWGGSLAYGHPFAATGGRILTQMLDILEQTDGEIGLASICAAGGLGVSVVLERAR